jgi:hypothetical protein
VKRVVVVIPHSHGWFWVQTCVSCLRRFPPVAKGCECQIVVVDNSWDFSPAIRGITETRLGDGITIIDNPKANKFHASALDHIVQTLDFDYLMAMESDVCVLRDGWLQWFMDQMAPNFFAVGHWHHEQFINPSCTLYHGNVLRDMNVWCNASDSLMLRWGERFEQATEETAWSPRTVAKKAELLDWICGPFAEKRGWSQGTVLRERPLYQMSGPERYEPGQALYHWARHNGDWGYLACPTHTAWRLPGWPFQTLYGVSDAPNREHELSELLGGDAYAAHFWLGTGSLNILKHPIGEEHDKYMRYGLPREGRFWMQGVDSDIRKDTLALIKKHGWHSGSKRIDLYHDRDHSTLLEEDRQAAALVESIYREAGVPI